MKRILSLFIMLANLCAFSQQVSTERLQPIIAEGKLLYYSEMASWHGNDLFFEKYKNADAVGGYFSYGDSGFVKCIFYSNADRPKVIGSVRFDTTYAIDAAILDLKERDFTSIEKELYLLRENTLNEMDRDTSFFKSYPNTDLNLVPLINGKERKVYVLTASQQDSVVLLGNDYLLSFDNGNKLLVKKKLHQSLIPYYYDEKDVKHVGETMHSHMPESGDFITATDICTLMLYEKFTKWKMHQVTSKNYLSIWNCDTNQLTVISTGTENANSDITMQTQIKVNKDLVRKSKKRGQPE
jgi:hypothetical protein